MVAWLENILYDLTMKIGIQRIRWSNGTRTVSYELLGYRVITSQKTFDIPEKK